MRRPGPRRCALHSAEGKEDPVPGVAYRAWEGAGEEGAGRPNVGPEDLLLTGGVDLHVGAFAD